MTRRSVGGPLDLSALALLSQPETRHRPDNLDVLAREARRLAAEGLTPRDIAAALRLAPAAVEALLVSRHQPPGPS